MHEDDIIWLRSFCEILVPHNLFDNHICWVGTGALLRMKTETGADDEPGELGYF